MGLTRRAFFQHTGVALTALGVSQFDLSVLGDRYAQALAQPTRRKLALLIGINQYPESVCDCALTKGSALGGCLTDVALQQELLIHRFGFQPADIVTLCDQSATRAAIATAFLEHLTAQARSGDVVVVHFSGLGSHLRFADAPDALRHSLVPVDGYLPTAEQPVINDLMTETLSLLVRSLQTEQVTTILDTSYAYPNHLGLQGNLRVRSRPSTPTGQINPQERALQERLLGQVGASDQQIRQQWQTGQLPGIVLSAASRGQSATEGQWDGFSAGLLTYALTQHLWHVVAPTTLRVSVSRIARSVNQVVGLDQQPVLSGQKSSDPSVQPYYSSPLPATAADGVITAVENDRQTVQIWLAGVPTQVLEHYGPNSILTAIATAELEATQTAAEETALAQYQVRSRDGLTVRAKWVGAASAPPPQVGQYVREQIRVVPRSVELAIALDASLERIERVDATSALASVPRVSAVGSGEPADYLFGKPQSQSPTLTAALPQETVPTGSAVPTAPTVPALPAVPPLRTLDSGEPPGPLSPSRLGYGLFNLGRQAIPGTLAPAGEAVKTAIGRITPSLQTLLANKLLRLTSNRHSSRLAVRATLETLTPKERMIAQQETLSVAGQASDGRLAALFVGDGALPTLPLGSRIRYRLENYGDRTLYFLLLGITSKGDAMALRAPSEGGQIGPSGSLLIPPPSAPTEWSVSPPTGLVETHLIVSRAPFTSAIAALNHDLPTSPTDYSMGQLSDPVAIAQAVLQDLHRASAALAPLDVGAENYGLDVAAWATLSFMYQSV